VVVTPHGQSVPEVGSGPAPVEVGSGPAPVVDGSGGPVTMVSNVQYEPTQYKAATGYTGHVPGMQYAVGTNFRRVADTCYTDLERQSQDRRHKLDRERAARVQEAGGGINTYDWESAPALAAPAQAVTVGSAGGGSDVKYSRYATRYATPDEVIPITGYTGYIPLSRSSKMGVGQTFGQFADESLHSLHEQVKQYHQSAQTA